MITEDTKDPIRVAAGKRSKTKGKVFERFIVNKLLEAGISAKRGWWQSGEFARFRGKTKPRIPDVILPGFWLELGTGASVDDYKKLDQAIGDSAGADIPIAIIRRKGARTIRATMRLCDLLKIVQESHADMRVSLRFEELVGILKPICAMQAPAEPAAQGVMFEDL